MAKKQDLIIHSIETTFRKLLVDDGASHLADVRQAVVAGGVLQKQHRLAAQADLQMERDAPDRGCEGS